MTQWVRPSYLNDSPLQYKRWQSRPPLKSSGAICRTGEMLSIIIIIAWSRLAMNGSHDYVILMLMIIMLMIRRSTWSRLAMNGGHVHEPKFSTRGRPALQHCHQNDSKHDNHYDQDGQDELICDHGHNKRKKFDECDNMRFVMQTWPKRWAAALLLFPSRSTLDLEPTGQPGHHYHHHHHHQPRHHHHHR